MKKGRFTEEQIIGVLKQHEAGRKVPDLAREIGVSAATIYTWKSKFGGMDVSDAQKLKGLEDENRRLKHLVADLSLDKEVLKAVIQKTGGACRHEEGRGVGLPAVSGERAPGLQADGNGSRQLSLRAQAGAQRSATRSAGLACTTETAVRISATACAADAT